MRASALIISLMGAGAICSTVADPVEAAPPARRSCGEAIIVYTANQSWLSRIYVLDMDGSVLHYFEYEYYIFSDLEVVDGEVYVTDWVAPRVYRVDLQSGALDVIVDDWSLLYMFDLAWNGSHFLLNEWSLNRYELDGAWAGAVSFDEVARGGACDHMYYWTPSEWRAILY